MLVLVVVAVVVGGGGGGVLCCGWAMSFFCLLIELSFFSYK